MNIKMYNQAEFKIMPLNSIQKFTVCELSVYIIIILYTRNDHNSSEDHTRGTKSSIILATTKANFKTTASSSSGQSIQ